MPLTCKKLYDQAVLRYNHLAPLHIMRRFTLCAVLAAAAGLVDAACQGNNCNRAVTGTRADQTALHRSDCSSFLAVTVTPATFTTTVTQTITPFSTVLTISSTSTLLSTTTLTVVPRLERRQVTQRATSVPRYATACSGAAQYSSACSCWGVTASTVTAPTPTHTVTVTASVTATQTTLFATTTTSVATAVETVCPPPRILCNGFCVDPRYDRQNCGTCGTACPAGRPCINGFCLNCELGPSCLTPQSCGNGDPSGCRCLNLQEGAGSGLCVSEVRGACNERTCLFSLDCPRGSVCAKGYCTGCANNYCVEVVTTCANILLPSRLFVRGLEVEREG